MPTHLIIYGDSNSKKPLINVNRIVKETCCVYMEKGRLTNTASKLIMTKPKCKRVTK